MRVLFVHPHYIRSEVPLGLLYLSAMLKGHGHRTALFFLNPCQPRRGEDVGAMIERCFREKMDDFAPDMVGFSVMSTAFDLSLRLASIAKKRKCYVIFGGPHPTVDPEGTIRQEVVDMICLGEGEYALMELVAGLENGQDVTGIANIWAKDGGGIHRNPLRPLIWDLDSLPLPDRSLLDVCYLDAMVRGANFITGRGCPYKCSYCINEYLQSIYRGHGPFVRFRDVGAVVEEIKGFAEEANPKKLIFSDEVFSLSKKRLIAFCNAYRREAGLPFVCQTRANAIDEETAAALRTAGCVQVSVGIESGNEHIRNIILNRKMGEDTIRKAFRLLRQAGIGTGTFNMIGMPGETEETIWETIQLNREVQSDYTHCTILMPFRGTKIREVYEESGFLEKEPSDNYYHDVTQRLPTISQRKLVAYQRLFDLYVYAAPRYRFVVDFLFFLWTHVPLKVGNVSPFRVLRSVAYRATRSARKLLVPGRGIPYG